MMSLLTIAFCVAVVVILAWFFVAVLVGAAAIGLVCAVVAGFAWLVMHLL